MHSLWQGFTSPWRDWKGAGATAEMLIDILRSHEGFRDTSRILDWFVRLTWQKRRSRPLPGIWFIRGALVRAVLNAPRPLDCQLTGWEQLRTSLLMLHTPVI
jgi:hypothetical protein